MKRPSRRFLAAIGICLAFGVLAGGIALIAQVHAEEPDPCNNFDMGSQTVPPELDSIIGFLAINADGDCVWKAETEPLIDVVVKLDRTDDPDPQFDQETKTLANGCFAFTSLPGNSKWTVTVPSTNPLLTYGLKCSTHDGNSNTFDVILPADDSPLHGFFYEPTPTHGGPGSNISRLVFVVAAIVMVVAVIIYLMPKIRGAE